MAPPINHRYTYMMLDSKFDQVVLIADCIQELADLAGVKRDTIDQTMSRARRKGTKCKYIRVLTEDDEELGGEMDG